VQVERASFWGVVVGVKPQILQLAAVLMLRHRIRTMTPTVPIVDTSQGV
jgi:hypothetical protein